jgi:cell division cycle 20-like protein 1 (cofactor of APC complex)
MLRLSSHCAAVKALAWSPHQSGLLASGGGTADRTIRFWNVRRAVPLWTESPVRGFGSEPLPLSTPPEIPEQLIIQASSQVCTLAWSPLRSDEVLSTHGFSEHNLALWSYPGGRAVGRFEGHSQRVLFQATGPDGSTVATGSGDQTIRFWNVFKAAGRSSRSRKKLGIDSVIFNSSR